MDRHAAKMERLETRYRESRVGMIRNYTDWLQGQPTDAQLGDWRSVLQGMGTSSKEAKRGAGAYRESVRELRRQNISRPMNQATDRLVAALTKLIENIAATERFCKERLAALSNVRSEG